MGCGASSVAPSDSPQAAAAAKASAPQQRQRATDGSLSGAGGANDSDPLQEEVMAVKPTEKSVRRKVVTVQKIEEEANGKKVVTTTTTTTVIEGESSGGEEEEEAGRSIGMPQPRQPKELSGSSTQGSQLAQPGSPAAMHRRHNLLAPLQQQGPPAPDTPDKEAGIPPGIGVSSSSQPAGTGRRRSIGSAGSAQTGQTPAAAALAAALPAPGSPTNRNRLPPGPSGAVPTSPLSSSLGTRSKPEPTSTTYTLLTRMSQTSQQGRLPALPGAPDQDMLPGSMPNDDRLSSDPPRNLSTRTSASMPPQTDLSQLAASLQSYSGGQGGPAAAASTGVGQAAAGQATSFLAGLNVKAPSPSSSTPGATPTVLPLITAPGTRVASLAASPLPSPPQSPPHPASARNSAATSSSLPATARTSAATARTSAATDAAHTSIVSGGSRLGTAGPSGVSRSSDSSSAAAPHVRFSTKDEKPGMRPPSPRPIGLMPAGAVANAVKVQQCPSFGFVLDECSTGLLGDVEIDGDGDQGGGGGDGGDDADADRPSRSTPGGGSDDGTPGIMTRPSRASTTTSRRTTQESMTSMFEGGLVPSGPSVAAIHVAGVTGADLVSRAVKRGVDSMRRFSADGAANAAMMEVHGPKKRHVSSCAVSLAFLLEFSSRVSAEMTTLDVVYKIIVPETARFRCRYVDYVPDDHLSTPDYFVSHRWNAPFKNLVTSLFLHFDCARAVGKGTLDPSQVFLWLDIFAVNQHPGEAQAGDLAGLQAALGASSSGTLLCLDEAGLVLTRIWCLYEVHHTIKLKGIPGLRVLAADVQFAELRDIFNSLDAAHAQATVEEDRKRILADIHATTGIGNLNRGIKEALVESCLLEARATEPRMAAEPAAYVLAHYKAGQMLRVAGHYREAEEALHKTIQVYENGLGKEDKQYAVCLITLGTLMQEEGKLVEAERLCREGLKMSESLLANTVAHYRTGGEETPGVDMTVADVMAAYNALAAVLQAQGKFTEALPYCEKTVSTCKRVHGDAHPDTATAMQSLALLLQAMGRSTDALKLLRKVLALREKHLGLDHPLTAVSYDALGVALQQRGAFGDAEPQILKALGIRRRVLGESHPAVGSSLHNLGGLMADEGRAEEAETFYVAALELREAVLGPGHPAFAATLNNLAALYKEAGRVDEAVPLLQHALEARTRALGPDHPATSSSLNNLATLLLERGHLQEAQPLYLEHIRVLEKVLGPAHADVALALQNYATCLRASKDLTQAATIFRRAMGILEATVGEEHLDLAHCCASLAALLQEQGQLGQASQQYERALAIKKKIYGDKHSSLVPLLHALGVLSAKQGALQTAESKLRAAIAMRRDLSTQLSTGTSRPLSAAAVTPRSKSLPDRTSPTQTGHSNSGLDAGAVAAGLLSRTASMALLNRTSVRTQNASMLEADCQLASSLTELGNVLQDLERLEDAHEAYSEALDLRGEALGDDHVDTALTREDLACLLLELARPAEAEPLLKFALEVNLVKSSGGVAALSAYNLGRCLEKLGATRWMDARDAYLQAVQLAEAALGGDHDDTMQYKDNLASFLAAGNPADQPLKSNKSKGGRKSTSTSKAASRANTRPASPVKDLSDDDDDVEIDYS